MLGVCENAELPEFIVQLAHKCGDTELDRAVIMVIEFLPFRRTCAKECTSGVDQVLALIITVAVHEEVFLLQTDGRDDTFALCAKKPQQDYRLFRFRDGKVRLLDMVIDGSQGWAVDLWEAVEDEL